LKKILTKRKAEPEKEIGIQQEGNVLTGEKSEQGCTASTSPTSRGGKERIRGALPKPLPGRGRQQVPEENAPRVKNCGDHGLRKNTPECMGGVTPKKELQGEGTNNGRGKNSSFYIGESASS